MPIRTPQRDRISQTTSQTQRRSRLDNPYWKPYRNSDNLAQQLYDLTHLVGDHTFAELKKEAAIAEILKPY
ncbi:MAG: hypothetical protein DCF25_11825 [Leptolyngbya foveolarum]|uniref:Uncharacterized protein n=1 Tax=Leptolyngbya foveolarum TaxID=47253 RepID=A0A2W4U6G8_9CYAN|nr:MAG: hypothetical protein DCF25_11825 [Leptolyngbya foveolarum]